LDFKLDLDAARVAREAAREAETAAGPISPARRPSSWRAQGVRAYEKAPAVRPGLFDVKKGVD